MRKKPSFIIAGLFFGISSVGYAQEPGIEILQPDDNLVSEFGNSQVFGVSLSTQPASKVILKLSVSDESEGRLDVKELEFLRENWNEPQLVTVTGLDDKEADGNVRFDVTLKVDYTKDSRYKTVASQKISFENIDDENPYVSLVSSALGLYADKKPSKEKVRIVTANITTGDEQSYDNGEGIRIFKAIKPDIVLIQEFNYQKNSIKSFVSSTFGNEYVYHRGTGEIPNGIISKYPIKESGSWKSNRVKNRQWDWAVIDIPGKRDLLVVSVHLYTQDNESEMEPLRKQIEQKIKNDNKDYYVMLGGDFNQPNWEPIREHFNTMFVVGTRYADWPQDQDGFVRTNVTRHKQIDYLLCNPDLCAKEVPTVIGKHSYVHGHVLDSRVYEKHGEMNDIAPVKPKDSEAYMMQHMAVIRDFEFDEDE